MITSNATIAGEGGPKHILGLRLSALVEILWLLAILLTIDGLIFKGDRFQTIEPHPFWIVVLLAAVQYGSTAGIAAAALSTAALLVGALPPQSFTQDFYDYVYQISILPILWFITAITLGELQARQVRRVKQLQALLRESTEREQVIGNAFQQVQSHKESLEERIAGQLQTVFTTYQAARAIEKLGTGEVLLGTADLVHSIMAARKFSVFLLNENVLEAAVSDGWAAEDAFSRRFEQESPLFQAIVGQRRFLCAASEDDSRILGAHGLLAGPLIGIDNGAIIGMLKIEDIGFLKLNIGSIENFRLLCEWIGTAYTNAQRYETAEALGSQHAVIFPTATFESHTRFLGALARRAGFPVTIVQFRVEPGHARLRAEDLRVGFRDVVKASLRSHDLMFDRGRDGREFVVVMPLATPEQATVIADRLIKRLHEQVSSDVSIVLTVQSLEKLFGDVRQEPLSREQAITQALNRIRDSIQDDTF